MSVKVMGLVFEHGPRKPADRLLLLAIADHADDYGLAWPSLIRLAEKTAVGEQQASRGVKRLEKAGWLTVIRGGGTIDGTHGRTSRYQITMAMLTTHPSEEGLPVPTPPSRATYPSLEGVPTPPPEEGEPSVEPSVNQNLRVPEDTHTQPDLFGNLLPLRSAAKDQDLDAEFTAWWSRYPRKVNRQEARKAYAQLRKEFSADFLLAALEAARDHLLESEERFRPHGSTWLRARRWEDEDGAEEPEPGAEFNQW